MEELIGSLRKFGLSEKESKVYLASLELGKMTASDIALKSDLPRTLVYDILERLIDDGLMAYSVMDKKKYFTASDPHELLRILKEKENSINDVLPKLERIQRLKGYNRPRVTIFEGKDGMKTMMNDILRSNVGEFLGYGSSRSSYDIIPAFMDEWHRQRIQKKVIMRIIYNNTKAAKEKIQRIAHSMKHTKYRLMPVRLESPTATIIYANKVVLQSWTRDPFAVMIESQEMADNHRKYFEELWRIAERTESTRGG